MQFLKILFWCLIAFVAALFTYGNWMPVQIHLWSGLLAEVKLPLLLAVTFLIGLLPPILYHQFTRWRLRSRLNAAEQTIADLRLTLEPPPGPDIAAAPVSVIDETPAPAPVTKPGKAPKTPPAGSLL